MKKALAILFALMMAVCLLPTIAFAKGKTITVGTADANYATLAAAVTAAQSGDTIVLTSDLAMTECARFYDKDLTIDGQGHTVTRGDNFKTLTDPARQEFNPAMIEVGGTKDENTGELKKASLKLYNITLDDGGKHEGTKFKFANIGKNYNGTECVQDAIISTYNGTGTITLGRGTTLKNFGGMTAVYLAGASKLTMEKGSVILDDTFEGRTVQALGAIKLIGGAKLDMQAGSEIKDLKNAIAIDADGTRAEKGDIVINGMISGLKSTLGNTPPVRLNIAGKVILGSTGKVINNTTAFISGIYVRNGSTLYVYGEVRGNEATAERGGGIYLIDDAYAYIEEDAVISNNKAKETGGGIMVNNGGNLIMNGGIISGNHAYQDGGGVEVRRNGTFVMNGGTIENNTAKGYGNGICLDAHNKPDNAGYFQLNGGKIVNNDIAIKSEGYAHLDNTNGFAGIASNLDIDDVSKVIRFETNTKTITPATLDIKFGNASTKSVEALTKASTDKGWSDPLATFWTQRDNAATMTVGGITITDLSMPVYALVQATDANGKPDSNAEVKVYATKVEENSVTFTIPGTGNNGCAVALVQPTGDFGNVVITGPAEIEQKPSATTYEIPYRATYTMSQNFKTMLAQLNLNPDGATSAINLRFVVELDNRLTAKKDEAIDKFIYTFDGAGVLEPIDNAIVVSADGHTITVPCTLEEGWQTAIRAEKIVMTLDGTGVLQAGDFIPGGVLGTTGNIQAFLPIQQEINVLIPANVCKTKMVGEEQKMYTVTYTDGVEGTTVFEDQTYEIKSGDFTPAFNGTPSRSGYTFTGWSPAVAPTVTDHVTYTAQWSENGGSHTHPDPKPVPVVTIPPKTGDMTLWQSILHFFGIR